MPARPISQRPPGCVDTLPVPARNDAEAAEIGRPNENARPKPGVPLWSGPCRSRGDGSPAYFLPMWATPPKLPTHRLPSAPVSIENTALENRPSAVVSGALNLSSRNLVTPALVPT